VTAASFPVALRLQGRVVAIVARGATASVRVARLRQAGAIVRMIDAAAFTPATLADAWLVLADTGDASLDAAVFTACAARRILCNAHDQPSACDFFLMSEEQLGTVTLAVGTNGAAPGLTGRLRREARDGLPADIDQLVGAYADLRNRLVARTDLDGMARRGKLRWLAAQPWSFFRQPPAEQWQQLIANCP